MKFYTSLIEDSEITTIVRYGANFLNLSYLHDRVLQKEIPIIFFS